jgi:NAD-dependent dihydropyrimidine dehydrogenase PreA subunit
MDACAFGTLEFEPQTDAAWDKAISNEQECTACGECLEMCPNDALSL